MKFVPVSALSLLALCVATAGCAVGPDFKAPAAPETDRYTAAELPAQTAATAVAGGEAQVAAPGKELPAQWWTLFGSEPLNALVQQAFANSPSTDAARAALRQAEAELAAQRGGLFPAIDANASAQRQRGAEIAPGLPSPGVYNLYNASISVGYTLDIFGGVRRGIEARAAAVDLQQYELQAAYLTLAANVVTASVAEAALRDQLQATHEIIDSQQKQLSITEQRFELGAAAFADVLDARANLASVRATLPVYEKQLAAVRNQLAVYLGKLPSEFSAGSFVLADLTLPQELPLSLPSELVRRRPDIRAAEARMHEASATIGVATANLLPQVSLSGSYGSQSTSSSNLFDDTIWSIGAGLVQPIFRGGTLTAQRRAAIAQYDRSAADYRSAVLTAFQDVADALTAVHSDAEALQARHQALTSAQGSLDLRQRQYALGSVSYLQLLIAQRAHQQARIDYAQALATRYQDTAALFQALGGNWNEDAPNARSDSPPQQEQTPQQAQTPQQEQAPQQEQREQEQAQ